jgi:hypothetical protein
MKMDFLFSTKTNSRKFQQAIKTYRAEHLEDVEAVAPDDTGVKFDS